MNEARVYERCTEIHHGCPSGAPDLYSTETIYDLARLGEKDGFPSTHDWLLNQEQLRLIVSTPRLRIGIPVTCPR